MSTATRHFPILFIGLHLDRRNHACCLVGPSSPLHPTCCSGLLCVLLHGPSYAVSAESLFTDKVTYYESGVSEAAEPEPMPTIWNWTASRSRHLARLVRSPFLGQQDHERLGPITKVLCHALKSVKAFRSSGWMG